jgi:hypothetical protein
MTPEARTAEAALTHWVESLPTYEGPAISLIEGSAPLTQAIANLIRRVTGNTLPVGVLVFVSNPPSADPYLWVGSHNASPTLAEVLLTRALEVTKEQQPRVALAGRSTSPKESMN